MNMVPNAISLDRRPVIDLTSRHFEHVHRGIRVIGTWYMDPDTRQSEPCLVLMDASKPVQRRAGARDRAVPCIIMQSDMWKWTVEIGDPMHVARNVHLWMASGALPGTPGNMPDVHRIHDAVMSRLRDLWSMPPMPAMAAVKHGSVPVGMVEVRERESGKVIQEVEMVSAHVRN